MSPIRSLIISSAYLNHSNATSYLAKDGRYDVVMVNENEVDIENIFSDNNHPLLIIVEWSILSNHTLYKKIINKCDKHEASVLVVVPVKDLHFYLEQASFYIKDFVLLPLSQLEFCARASMSVGRRPTVLPPGFVRIDSHLSINFNEKLVRIGRNQLIDLTVTDALFLKHLYKKINHWVNVEELDRTAFGLGNLKVETSKRVQELIRKIEDDPKRPRYLKKYSPGIYMLYSNEYPPGDSLIGFDRLKRMDKSR